MLGDYCQVDKRERVKANLVMSKAMVCVCVGGGGFSLWNWKWFCSLLGKLTFPITDEAFSSMKEEGCWENLGVPLEQILLLSSRWEMLPEFLSNNGNSCMDFMS